MFQNAQEGFRRRQCECHVFSNLSIPNWTGPLLFTNTDLYIKKKTPNPNVNCSVLKLRGKIHTCISNWNSQFREFSYHLIPWFCTPHLSVEGDSVLLALIVNHYSSSAFFNNRYSPVCLTADAGTLAQETMSIAQWTLPAWVWLCFSVLTRQPIKQNISLCRLCGTCEIQHREHDRVGTLHYYFLIILQLQNIWQMMVQAVTRQML